jgi:tetratricopeptide (TPR) repeat protein
LTPKERLELFVPVCQAIQHAHQKGIIHRDIKPSNVLIAMYDGKPVPKVIDFGIAKATGQQLTEKTLVTGFGNVVGTLEYMSPEQAELNQLDIDTRSDVYSLGVLLYELLTGSTPLERKRLKEAALLEVLRVIREEEPPRPSTRLSTTDGLPSVAANRGLEPKKLSGLVRGELDWIVMKALEKDRNRRYESANGFAQDVQRYLADEPVQACPPSAWYRMRKFARRHKTGLAVAGLGLFFLAVLGSGVGWLVSDRAARRTRAANELGLTLDRAALFLEQGKRAEALAALDRADLLAGEALPDPARDERLAALKERLAAEARDQEFVSNFEDIRLRVQSGVNLQESHFNKAAASREIQDALGRYGIAIGAVTPAEAGARVLGRPEAVRRNLVAALEECLGWMPKGDTRTWLLEVLAAADNDPWRAQVRKAFVAGDWKALGRLAREADVKKQPPSFLSSLAGTLPETMKPTRLKLLRRVQRAYPADLWANVHLAGELYDNGQPAEAVRYYTAALALRPNNPGLYLNRGRALNAIGELDAMIADYRQAVALAPRYPEAHANLGFALFARGRVDEAIGEYREALRLKPNLAGTHTALGNALFAKGRLDDAIAAHRKAIRLSPDYALAHSNLGSVLFNKGRLDDAIAEFREAIRLDPDAAVAHGGLGAVLGSKGRFDEAIAECREAIRLKKDFAEGYRTLGAALSGKRKLNGAIAAYREAIRLNKNDAVAHNNLGNNLLAKGELDEAIAAYREAIRIKEDFALAHHSLGNALRTKGQVDDAIAAFREAIRLEPGDATAHFHLASALSARGRGDEAITPYREAIRLKKDFAEAHTDLGVILWDKGQRPEAIACYREAIRLKKDYAEPYCNLGLALLAEGDFRSALEALRRGHELGSRRPEWRHPSAQWVRECKRLLELEGRLPDFLAGKATPAGAAERIALAELCVIKHLDRAACNFYEEAFAAEPNLAAANRYAAARAAARAGCGRAKDDKLDDKERARLRRQGLNWLQADLEAWRRLVDKKPDKGPSAAVVARTLQLWLADPGFAAVREPKQLTQLPEAERQSWRQLWAAVADTLARARQEASVKNKSDAP